jgi:penicillin amidase
MEARVMKRRIAYSLILPLCLSAVTWIGRAQARPGALSDQVKASLLELIGLRGDVTIRHDERGVTYIEAENEEDLYFAEGYAVARDRLWQMELLRRTARGELSEILGRAVLEEDKRHRTLGFAALSEQLVGRSSPPTRAALQAYARGVNSFIASLDEKSLPTEFRILKFRPAPWRPADSLVIGKLFAEALNNSWQTDLMRMALAGLPKDRQAALLPSTSPLDIITVGSDTAKKKPVASYRPTKSKLRQAAGPSGPEMLETVSEIGEVINRSLRRAGLYAEDLAASNSWVVNGKHTVTGKPLLANDPHLSASAPSIWYMVHLSAPGLRVAGVTVAGVPDIVIGHNEQIAWGTTNVGADLQDLYIVKFDKDNPRRYLTPTGWREAEVRQEKIKVRKNPTDPATETVQFDVTVTRHGPIFFEKEGLRYALAWPALDPTSNELEAYYWVNRARNWQEFRTALSRYTGFPLNFVYADVTGHIGFWAPGRYPIRKSGHGEIPYDGATDAGDWIKYIPFEATPHIYDPSSGIIVTANNRTVGLDYPYHITFDWTAPYRARRIYNLLTAKKKLSLNDFLAIQADTYSLPDATFTAQLLKIGQPLAATSPEWRDIVDTLSESDAKMDARSRAMPLAYAMRTGFQRRILAGALGPDLARRYSWANAGTFFDSIITSRPREWLPKEFDSYDALLLASYKEATETLTKRIGADKSQWAWGRYVQVRFTHPLASIPLAGAQFVIAPIPQNGGGPTINTAGFVSMRLIADTDDWDNTRQGITLGQSGDPNNVHWKDQLADWQSVSPRVFPFGKNAVVSATKSSLDLTSPKAQR